MEFTDAILKSNHSTKAKGERQTVKESDEQTERKIKREGFIDICLERHREPDLGLYRMQL